MKAKVEVKAGSSDVAALVGRAQAGDRIAFEELQAIGESRGISYTEGWSRHMVLLKIQDRASEANLLARAGIRSVVDRVEEDLAEAADGPIERLIIGRAALCAADMNLSEREYQYQAIPGASPAPIEALDRRRERSQRMLLAALKALASVRRMNRPVVQVNVGDGNLNMLKA